jgi:glycosyltransferase involved in cell wall biosynthesis
MSVVKSMDDNGISIVIPNWNHEVFLARSAASAVGAARLLRGLGVPTEVLLVDDASRDGSHGLLRQLELRHADEPLRVVIHPRNTGPAQTRNTALLEARGRYIFFLDADNEVVPSSLPVLYRSLCQTRAVAVYGNVLIRQPGQQRATGIYSNECVQPSLFRGNYIDTMALADRLQLLDLGGFHDALPHEDWELWQHVVAEGRLVVFVPVVVGFYYELPLSNLRLARDGDAIRAKSKRIFDQSGFRQRTRVNAYFRRYHPDVGDLSTASPALEDHSF